MNKMKYIVIDNGLFEAPVVFDEATTHNDMAFAVGGTVVSAGFIEWIDGKLVCYGRSVSLNINSREDEDTKLIMRMLGANDD